MADGHLILVAGALLSAGLVASLLAGRLRVPSLLLFLGVGMLVGSEGAGWIAFDDYQLARTIGIIALALLVRGLGLAALPRGEGGASAGEAQDQEGRAQRGEQADADAGLAPVHLAVEQRVLAARGQHGRDRAGGHHRGHRV